MSTDDPLARRIARHDRLEPPAELDRIVLAHAREAIEASEPETYYHTPRWAVPFALAATLVLVAAVVAVLHVVRSHATWLATASPVAVSAPAAMREAPGQFSRLRLLIPPIRAASRDAPACAPGTASRASDGVRSEAAAEAAADGTERRSGDGARDAPARAAPRINGAQGHGASKMPGCLSTEPQ